MVLGFSTDTRWEHRISSRVRYFTLQRFTFQESYRAIVDVEASQNLA